MSGELNLILDVESYETYSPYSLCRPYILWVTSTFMLNTPIFKGFTRDLKI